LSGGDRRAEPSTRRSLSIAAAKPELRRLSDWLHVLVREDALPEQAAFALDLGLHEAVANVIAHGFDDERPHTIVVTYEKWPDRVQLEVQDDGRPFDPLAAPPRPALTTLEDAIQWGHGLLFIRRFLDQVVYRRATGRNHLTLTQRLTTEPQE